MPCQNFTPLSRVIEKLDMFTSLSPCLDTDEELASTMIVLMEVVHDYVGQARHLLEAMTAGKGDPS